MLRVMGVALAICGLATACVPVETVRAPDYKKVQQQAFLSAQMSCGQWGLAAGSADFQACVQQLQPGYEQQFIQTELFNRIGHAPAAQ